MRFPTFAAGAAVQTQTLGDVALVIRSRYFIFVHNSSTILLAEDDGMDAELMLMGFKTEGIPFSIKVVDNGAQVIQYLQGAGKYGDRAEYPMPALILLDMRMRCGRLRGSKVDAKPA